MKKYVCGLVFSLDGHRILLIHKNRPSWQAGLVNFGGGKLEEGETALQAVRREILEEFNLNLSTWTNFCELKGNVGLPTEWSVEFFFTYTNKIGSFVSKTDEQGEIFLCKMLPDNTLKNVPWLTQMALNFGLDSAGKFVIQEIDHN